MSTSAPSARAAFRSSGDAASPSPRSGRAERIGAGGRTSPRPAGSGPVHYLLVLDTALPLGPVMYRFRALFDDAVAAGRCARFDAVVPAVRLNTDDRRFVRAELGDAGPGDAADALGAHWRRDRLIEDFGSAGLQVGDVTIGSDDVVRSAAQALEHRDRTDAVLVVTEPLGMSRWVRLDVPSRIARRTGVPVSTIEVDPTVI